MVLGFPDFVAFKVFGDLGCHLVGFKRLLGVLVF